MLTLHRTHPEQHQKTGPGPGTSISIGVTNNEAAATTRRVPVEDPLAIDVYSLPTFKINFFNQIHMQILRRNFHSMRICSPPNDELEGDISSWVSGCGNTAKETSNL